MRQRGGGGRGGDGGTEGRGGRGAKRRVEGDIRGLVVGVDSTTLKVVFLKRDGDERNDELKVV